MIRKEEYPIYTQYLMRNLLNDKRDIGNGNQMTKNNKKRIL